MAKKQAIATETAAAAPARAAKPKSTTPRVRSTRHSKTAPVEPVIARMDAVHVDTPQAAVDPHDAIARMAYGYWESRGYQHGMHIEDWLRAEKEYEQQSQPALA